MSTSEQLERETEETRAQIVDSLTELRERMTPGRIVDEAFDFARDGRAGQFVRNLGHQASENPMPVALIGAGLAWLMFGGRSNGSARNGSRVSASASDAASRAVGAVSDTSQDALHAGGRIKDAATEMTSDAADSARRAMHDLTDRAGSAASDLAARAGSAKAAAGQAAGGLASFLKDEPMVLAGLGVALGAVLGAAFPASETENRLMGQTSDAVKEDVTEAAEQQWEKGKAAMEAAAEKAWGDGHDGQSGDGQNVHETQAAAPAE